MTTIADRLKEARESAGFATSSDAARALNVPVATYHSNENGLRPFGRERAEIYARRFGVDLTWLLTGRGQMKGKVVLRQVPLSGRVGAGALVEPINQDVLEHLEVPYQLGAEAEAVEVFGDSMWPAIQEGEILIYDRVRHDPSGIVGSKVVAKLTDGRMFVKLLGKRNKDGLWTLLSFNGPPMEDVDLEWAAEIRVIMKR